MTNLAPKSNSHFDYAIGIDPGLQGGAMVLISSNLEVIEFVDIKASSLGDSADTISDGVLGLIEKYRLEAAIIVCCIEDTNIFGGGQQGKSIQLKNIGTTYGCVRYLLRKQLQNGRNIRLITAYQWKKQMALDQTPTEDESHSAYQSRKKSASKQMAIQILQDAGYLNWGGKISRFRPDFAEAFLMAIYALEPGFLDGHKCKVSRQQIAGGTLPETWLIEEEADFAWKILGWDRRKEIATIEKLPGYRPACDADGSVTFNPVVR
jgi:hypothetical protein